MQSVGDQAKYGQMTGTNFLDRIFRLVNIHRWTHGCQIVHDELSHDASEGECDDDSAYNCEARIVNESTEVRVVGVIVCPLRVIKEVPDSQRDSQEKEEHSIRDN